MRTGLRAVEHFTAPSAQAVACFGAEELARGRIDPHHPTVFVDLDDGVGCSIDDRGQLLAFAIQGFTELGAAEGDGELVARKLDYTDSVRIEGRAICRPEGQEPLRWFLADRQDDHRGRTDRLLQLSLR